MELKQLNDKKSELENAFNSLESEKQGLTKRLNEINTEQVKIQGAHSLVSELIENFKKEKK
jgi:hypothetical protein